MRFDFYAQEPSRRLATLASDRLLSELEKFHRNQSYGQIKLEVEVRRGEPAEVTVTPEERIKPRDLFPGDANS